ncbi:uncharacterized protein QYS62_010563 [Fusarium acuminatum]|uniref:Uncharacterized protein n=1 Tax=Fusarium acuminatum TaxID=5515 RepID=A0ABZ2XC66_9HYPO
MLQSRTLSIALWVAKCVAFGGEDFQLNKAPDMVSLSDAAIHVQAVSAVAPGVAHVFPAAAALVTPDNVDHPNATNPLRKFAAVPAMPVSRGKTASTEVVAAAEKSSAALLVATTQTLQFAVEALEEIARKGMIAWKGVGVVHPVRSVAVTTVRVTTDIEPDTGNAPEFTCVPMTATNDEGATLELDDGCVLHYAPPEATSTEEAAARLRRDAETAPANLNAGLGLLARQASCTPYATFTRTVYETETSTETGTRTVTIQGEDGTFSCPEMEVTNDVGDVLALDAECALSFSPAEVTSTADTDDATAQDEPTEPTEPTADDQGVTATAEQSASSTTASAAGESQTDNAGSVDGVHGMLMMGFAGASSLWIIL